MPATAAPPTPPDQTRPGRSLPGTVFVVACALAAAAFVAFLVFVSPLLLARTRAAAPPPAPREIASGAGWVATAVGAGEDEPCLEVVARDAAARLCTGPRGASLRGVTVLAADGFEIAYGIVDARTTAVRLALRGAADVRAAPAYVDFGFPLGFFAVELPPGSELRGVDALGSDGDRRGAARCAGQGAGTACEVADQP